MAGSLFSKAKAAAPATKAATEDKKVMIVIKDPTFFDKVEKLEKLQDNLKRDKAEADMIADELKDMGKAEWCELYSKTSRNPGSVIISGVNKNGDSSRFMLVPSDGYLKINSTRADELTEKYGADIVEEKTKFELDLAMVEKYGEILSNLIEQSPDITEQDKESIIKAVVTYNIAKGTIDKLKVYSPDSITEIFEDVKPITSLKTPEVIKMIKS